MEKSPPFIKFFFNDVRFSFPDRKRVKSFIKSMVKLEKKKIGSLNYVFSTDKHLQTLNKKYLNHNYKTDILTFPTNKDSSLEAEVYISIERVKDNAKFYNGTFRQELLRVIFHGTLHLCGYKDKSNRQQRAMRKLEDHYLKLYESFT